MLDGKLTVTLDGEEHALAPGTACGSSSMAATASKRRQKPAPAT
ncbi:hypothetical protein V6L77_13860 [Pannonibacter sp. Pt2-lr]